MPNKTLDPFQAKGGGVKIVKISLKCIQESKSSEYKHKIDDFQVKINKSLKSKKQIIRHLTNPGLHKNFITLYFH